MIFNFLDIDELERRKLIVLIPFQLLRLRETIEKKRTPENLEALKSLIRCDILEFIDRNVAAGNITISDARILRGITWKLYRHIYQKYEEMEEAGVNQLVESAMILDVDILEKEHREELERIKTETDQVMKAKDNAIKAKDNTIRELMEKFRSLGVSDGEIQQIANPLP